MVGLYGRTREYVHGWVPGSGEGGHDCDSWRLSPRPLLHGGLMHGGVGGVRRRSGGVDGTRPLTRLRGGWTMRVLRVMRV